MKITSANEDGHANLVRPRLANPAPLGLFSFASTTLILSLYNIHTRSITHPNVVVGMALFCGGLGQLLAGMWSFPKGDTFDATAFSSYGVFWLSYATVLIPGSGILSSYTSKSELASAIGIYLITWAIVTAYFCIISFGKNISFIILFFLVTTTFSVLAAGELNNAVNSTKAGGVLGIIAAAVAYYVGVARLLESEEHPPFSLPLGHLHHPEPQLTQNQHNL